MKKITSEVSSHKEQYGTIVATVHDKYGNLKQRVEQPVDSFNRQTWRILYGDLSGISTTLIYLSGGNASLGEVYKRTADAGINGYSGIVIGSGINPTSYDTVAMQTIIDLGESSGQLRGLNSTAEFDQSTGIATLTRSFVSQNSSSGLITVNEVGIATGTAPLASKSVSTLMVRDVLLSSVIVDFEEILTIQYKLRISSGTNNWTNIVIRPYGISDFPGTVSLTNTTNTATTISLGYNILGAEGNDKRGIVVGTSNTAFIRTQVDLGSKILHGNSAGQLFYHPTTNGALQENSTSNSVKFMFTRAFENRSGSNIEVREVGLFTNIGAVSSYMFDRRVIEPPVTITNGNTVAFSWEFCYEV
jgi:hypothetical protein